MKPEEAIDRLNMMIADNHLWKQYTPDGEESFKEALVTAIQALEKRVAKKPNNERFSRNYELAEHNIMEGECPNCGDTITGNSYGYYCGGCGEAIDWGKE